MIYANNIQGKHISLKSVSVDDIGFISKLRSDDELCKFVHKVDTSYKGQEGFILWQRDKENDYYFLIKNGEGNPIGTIALYNFEGNRAELGRWISYGNAFENLESVILIYDFAFEVLGLSEVVTCTNIENDRVISFWQRFGYDATYEEKKDDYVSKTHLVTQKSYEERFRHKMVRLLRY